MVDIADAGGKSWLRFAEPKALREGGVDHSVRIRLVTQVTTEGGSIGLGSDDLAAVRSDERRVGKGCVSTCRSRRSQHHSKKKNEYYGAYAPHSIYDQITMYQ